MEDKRKFFIIGIIIAIIIVIIITIIIIMNGNKQAEEPIKVENLIKRDNNVQQNVSIEDEPEEDEKLSQTTIKGEIVNVRTKYKDENGEIAVIPEGYAVVTDANTISNGLVISDVKGDDLNNSKQGNQFVWIPVELPTIDMSKFSNETDINEKINELVQNKKYPMAMKMADGNYKGILYRFEPINENTEIKVGFIAYSESNTEREPANLEDNSDVVENWTQDKYQNEYNELVKRVKNDKGFWIARFETSIDSNGNAQSKKNQIVTTNKTWYQMYNYEKMLGKNNVNSGMVWGSQWDQVMIWMKNIRNTSISGNKYYILDSSNMGNYINTEIKEIINNRIETVKKDGEAVIYKTGVIPQATVRNICDMAGNVWEWTMEANFTSSRTVRGGDCSYDGITYPASAKFSFQADYTGEKIETIGSRMTIY